MKLIVTLMTAAVLGGVVRAQSPTPPPPVSQAAKDRATEMGVPDKLEVQILKLQLAQAGLQQQFDRLQAQEAQITQQGLANAAQLTELGKEALKEMALDPKEWKYDPNQDPKPTKITPPAPQTPPGPSPTPAASVPTIPTAKKAPK
jgi:hypothetical protein